MFSRGSDYALAATAVILSVLASPVVFAGEDAAVRTDAKPAAPVSGSAATAVAKPDGHPRGVRLEPVPPAYLVRGGTEIRLLRGPERRFEQGPAGYRKEYGGIASLLDGLSQLKKDGELEDGLLLVYDLKARGDEDDVERRLVEFAIEKDIDLFTYIGEMAVDVTARWLVMSSHSKHRPPDPVELARKLKKAGFNQESCGYSEKEAETYGTYRKKTTLAEAAAILGGEVKFDRPYLPGGEPGGPPESVFSRGPDVHCHILGDSHHKGEWAGSDVVGVTVTIWPAEFGLPQKLERGLFITEVERSLITAQAADISNRVAGRAGGDRMAKTYVLPDGAWLGIVYSVGAKAVIVESLWLASKDQVRDKPEWTEAMKQVETVKLADHRDSKPAAK